MDQLLSEKNSINMFEVKNPGMLTTIQDLGRKNYQKYGISVSGSVDDYAHRIANILVSNPENAALLEVTIIGLKLKALERTIISVTGGDLSATLNTKPIPLWTSIEIKKGDEINFKGCKTGCRAYLAIKGGIDAELFFGSRSTDLVGKFGGMKGRSLERGDMIKVNTMNKTASNVKRRSLRPTLIPEYNNEVNVRVILGPQAEAFKQESIDTFFSHPYIVTKDLDRMACRLEGPKIEHEESADIDSEGLFLGAIQIPRNGLPIVFLTGRQSIGGYTKIGGVISVDLPKLAQLKQGDTINFEQIEIEESHELLLEYERTFNILNLNVR